MKAIVMRPPAPTPWTARATMWQLIGARAVPGVGAGGLMTMAFIVISDLVSPRDRPRYQGFFAATFGLASIAGPLVGGYFADHDWRWIFYLNIPLVLVSLVTISLVLKVTHNHRRPRVDYVGAVLMIVGVSLMLLMLSWGGTQYPWGSGIIIGLGLG